MPTLLIGPNGFAPIVIPGGGGGPSTFTGPNGTPNSNGLETGPNGIFSAVRVPLSSLVPVTSLINPATGAHWPSGDITLTVPTTITGAKISGRVINHSTGSTLQSCWVAGGSTSGVLVDCTSTSAGSLALTDCLVAPATPGPGFTTSIIGGSYTATRTEVKNCIDGFGAYNHSGQPNCDVKIINCLSHLLYADLTDGGQKNNGVAPGPSHNDCLQYQGGNNCWILGSQFLGFVDPTIGDGPSWNSGTDSSLANQREFGPAYQCNSCIQTNQNNGFAISSGFRIEGNFFDGGSPYSVNLSNLNGKFTKTIVDTLLNNMWGHNQGGWASDGHGNTGFTANNGGDNTYAIAATNGVAQINNQSNNVYFDDMVAVNVRVA